MRILDLQGLLCAASVLYFSSLASGASVVSTSSCTYQTLLEKVPEMANELPVGGGAYNDDEISLVCTEGFEALNSSAKAICEQGVWKLPDDFQCVKSGFCKMFFKTSAFVKVLPWRSSVTRNKVLDRLNIYNDDEGATVSCRGDSQITRSYKCKKGKWEPSDQLECESKDCPPPPTLENGIFKLQIGGLAEPRCNNGFQQKGSTSIYCHNGTWAEKKNMVWPICERIEVIKTPRSPLEHLQWVALVVGVLLLIGVVILMIFCYVRKESPKRNRLMHNTSHVDELLHLRRTKPIVIPDPVSHTQVHYTHDRKPIPVTSL